MFRFIMFGALFLAGCGTRYHVDTAATENLAAAQRFIDEASNTAEPAMAVVDVRTAIDAYVRTVARVEPVAEQVCREEHPDAAFAFCDFRIQVPDVVELPVNAYQTIGEDGRPEIWMTLALVAQVRNEDEIAFVLGHEAGHHIAEHLKKQEQQRIAGAIILGAISAMGQAAAAYNNPHHSSYQSQQAVSNAVAAGSALGRQAYSQTYELESDMLGTYIAERAGFDPLRGSRFFAKRTETADVDGAMSLWATHPRSPERVALVAETVQEIRAMRASGKTPRPRRKAE